MMEIGLNLGRCAIVDAYDFERINKYKWQTKNKAGRKHYASRNTSVDGKRVTLIMHRVIMSAPDGVECDHINGNTLDNRRGNLRLCNRQQNLQNKKGAHRNNKLGIKGVHQASDRNKFKAQIGVNGKNINLGHYNVLGDADSAYRIAEEKYFGKFARVPETAS